MLLKGVQETGRGLQYKTSSQEKVKECLITSGQSQRSQSKLRRREIKARQGQTERGKVSAGFPLTPKWTFLSTKIGPKRPKLTM